MSPRELACQDLVELITDYLEGALPPAEVAAVEAHLAECDGCDRYLDQMRATLRAIGTVPVATLPEEAVGSLLAAFAGNAARDGDETSPPASS
jgi:anti-sigma factor RsiW